MEENKLEQQLIERSNEIAIHIDLDELLATRIEAEMPLMPSSSLCSIYRVPKELHIGNEDTYEPRIVSIGPYHHGKDTLKASEDHKKWYLQALISRSVPPKTSLKEIVKAIRGLEALARECYAESLEDLASDDFVMMMVLDGCSILQLLYKFQEMKDEDEGEDVKGEGSSVSIDPIFSTTWMKDSFRWDLVLLENQLPFFVLECLFDLCRDPKHNYSLNYLITSFLAPIIPTSQINHKDSIKGKHKHLLDLLRNCLLPSSPHQMEYGDYPVWEFTQYSATDLWDAGVKFKKKEAADGLLDITFSKNGTLEIPPIFYGSGVTVLLPNLIALEQCRQDYKDQITSYVVLLDSLVNSKDDVKLLRDKGIIDGLFDENAKIATEINNLCKGAYVDKYYYDGLCSRVNVYCRTDWNKWRVTLKRDYFNTPWAILSFAAAVVLLLLTLIQTVFSVLSYISA